jgi:hypothetical protein
MADNEPLKFDDLLRFYRQGIDIDYPIYSEMRSNILLISGEHWSKKSNKWFDRVREDQKLDPEAKIRLTKNHMQKAMKIYVNNLLAMVPEHTVVPYNDKEVQDQKAAELHNAVMEYHKKRLEWDRKQREFAQDFFHFGEVACKIYFDTNKGDFVGYEQALDDLGMPMFDAMGQPVPSKNAVFKGDFCVDRIFGFNLFRPVEAQSWSDAKWVGVRKLVDKKATLAKYKDDEAKKKFVETASNESFLIFENILQSYKVDSNDIQILEIYHKPCPEYPEGYFWIFTTAGTLEEGPLPFGKFPIVIQTCDEFQTSPRGRSPIKHGRPYQAEINRAASKVAEHQITLGDDKLIFTNGSKVSQGQMLPGVRTIYTSGPPPAVVQGRTGDQYIAYIDSQIKEFYEVMMITEEVDMKGEMDPYAALFRSMKAKKPFILYADKFSQFCENFWDTLLTLSKEYLDGDELIYAVGKREQINVAEFKAAKPIGYQIKIKEMGEDVESMMGKQVVLNHVLQYAAPQLSRDDIGMIIKNMPLANSEEIFSDLTVDYENAKNDVLMLERGEMPQLRSGQNFAYTLKRLTSRMKQADFMFLDPRIQEMYKVYEQILAQAMAQEQQIAKMANADFIPAQGFLTPCDFYVPDPTNPGKTRRARLPIDSLSWLVQRLEQQGVALNQLDQLQPSAQAAVATASMTGATAQGSSGEALNYAGQITAQGDRNVNRTANPGSGGRSPGANQPDLQLGNPSPGFQP